MPRVEVGWTMKPSVFADLTEIEHNAVQRKVAIEIGTRLVYKTPVDTGRARGGWLPSIDSPAGGEGGADPTGQQAVVKIMGKFSRNAPAYRVYYITNNVPYIGDLNNGHSQQAPAHFVEMAVAEVINVL